jgi:hypothetical protein
LATGLYVLTFVVFPLVAASGGFVIDLALVARNGHGLFAIGLATDDELAVACIVVPAYGELSAVLTVLGGNDIAFDSDGTIIVVAISVSVNVRHGTGLRER